MVKWCVDLLSGTQKRELEYNYCTHYIKRYGEKKYDRENGTALQLFRTASIYPVCVSRKEYIIWQRRVQIAHKVSSLNYLAIVEMFLIYTLSFW